MSSKKARRTLREAHRKAATGPAANAIGILEGRLKAARVRMESYYDPENFIDPLERWRDGDSMFLPTGSAGNTNDRKQGRYWPTIRDEQQLRDMRTLSRMCYDNNYLALSMRDRVVEFTIGEGFRIRVVSKGIRPGPYDSGYTNKTSAEVKNVQAVIDEWQALNSWCGGPWAADPANPEDDATVLQDRETEGLYRLITDGMVMCRFFKGDDNTNGLPLMRWVEAECLRTPPGESLDGPYSWGIRTDPDDIETRKEYYIRYSESEDGEHVQAWKCVHLKSNTPSNVKIGIPDISPLWGDIERVRKLLTAMGEVSAILAQIAYLRQHAEGVTSTQAQTMIDGLKDFNRPKSRYDGRYNTIPEQWQIPGTVHDVSSGMEYVPPPMLAGAPGFIQVEQAILRAAGMRWGMPEFFTGDASNNNYASISVTGSTFDRSTKARQKRYGLFHKAIALKVIGYAVQSGRLSASDARSVDVVIEHPSVSTTDTLKETQRLEILARNKVISQQTWQSKEGLDTAQETANIQAYDEIFPDLANPPDIFGNPRTGSDKP